jgi:hypothetical protein
VDPIFGLDVVGKRRNPCPSREPNSGRPARSLVTVVENTFHFLIIVLYPFVTQRY